LEAKENVNVHRYPKWRLATYFNTKRPPFDDVKLRRAVQKALDMEEIMLSVGKKPDNIELIPYPYREDSVWYSDVWKPYYNQQDIEGAKRLMREAGYNGEELVYMTTKDYIWMYDMALPLTDQLTDIGFNIKLEVVDWPTLVRRRSQVDEWDMFTTGGGPSEDPIMATGYYMGDYPGWYTSPEVRKQLGIIAREDDFEKRYEASVAMYEIIARDVPHVHPGWLFEFRGFGDNIKGLPHWVECVLWNVYKQ
jgi:peptide/nickel transport system substrate-binding protein